MIANELENPAVKAALIFGEIALDMGFLTTEHVQEALTIQRCVDSIDKSGKLIGDIVFEKGWMTVEQIYDVQWRVFKRYCG